MNPILLAASLMFANPQEAPAQTEEINEILQRFAEDYRFDPMALDAMFGISVGGDFWTVSVKRVESASKRGRLTDHSFGPHDVTLTHGAPPRPTWYFDIESLDVLRKIQSGEVNAATAAMKSFGSDRVGVDTKDMDGFHSTSGDEAQLYQALSHFFTMGTPEIIQFGFNHSLQTHGAQATALHFMKGTRVLYFTIMPEEVVNADPRLQRGQMPNLFVVTKGEGVLLSDNGEQKLSAGTSVFIAPFVRHEIRATGDAAMEGVLVLYGDNSDFGYGTSYPAFLQDLYDFYGRYPFRKDGEQ